MGKNEDTDNLEHEQRVEIIKEERRYMEILNMPISDDREDKIRFGAGLLPRVEVMRLGSWAGV